MSSPEENFVLQLRNMPSSLEISDDQLLKFRHFYDNLIKWNSVMNLTAITEIGDVYCKHFLDSLSLLYCVSRETLLCTHNLIDIGSGAGFPGIPIAIMFPEIQITLVDSLEKRVRFLQDSISLLELHNAEAIHSRAEDLGHNTEYREKYDLAVSRAVANLSTLNEYCLPFVRTGGSFIAYKSEKAKEEIENGRKAALKLGAEYCKTAEFTLPGSSYKRELIEFRKMQRTDKRYPRKAGTPQKRPLGTEQSV